MSAGAERRELRLDVFFIVLSLSFRGLAGAENSQGLLPRREPDHQQTQSGRMPDDDLPLFADGVVLVVEIPANGSANTVSASSNETPCFDTLAAAFLGSHSNFRRSLT